jgi:branched-chain amino acid transport system substrate-binding protein
MIKILILNLLLFGAFLPFTHSAADERPISIGIIASLSGPAGEQGKNWFDGAELAVDDLATKDIWVTLHVEDDLTQPVNVAKAFQRLVSVEKVNAIVGGTWDFLGLTAYPLAARYKIPFITPTNPVEIVLEGAKNNPYVFTNGISIKAVEAAAEKFFAAHPVKSAGLLYPQLPWGRLNAEAIRKAAASKSIPIIAEETFPLDGDLADALRQASLKIFQKKPELVFIATDYNGVDLTLRLFQQLKFFPTALTAQHLDRAFELSHDTVRYDKAYGIYPLVVDSSFEKRFQARFNQPAKVFAANGYDAVMFLGQALAQKVDFLKRDPSFVYQGATGEHKFRPGSPGLTEPTAVIMTTNGGYFHVDNKE